MLEGKGKLCAWHKVQGAEVSVQVLFFNLQPQRTKLSAPI